MSRIRKVLKESSAKPIGIPGRVWDDFSMLATDPNRKDSPMPALENLFPYAGDFACSNIATRTVTFTSGFNGARYEMTQPEWTYAVNSAIANIPA